MTRLLANLTMGIVIIIVMLAIVHPELPGVIAAFFYWSAVAAYRGYVARYLAWRADRAARIADDAEREFKRRYGK